MGYSGGVKIKLKLIEFMIFFNENVKKRFNQK